MRETLLQRQFWHHLQSFVAESRRAESEQLHREQRWAATSNSSFATSTSLSPLPPLPPSPQPASRLRALSRSTARVTTAPAQNSAPRLCLAPSAEAESKKRKSREAAPTPLTSPAPGVALATKKRRTAVSVPRAPSARPTNEEAMISGGLDAPGGPSCMQAFQHPVHVSVGTGGSASGATMRDMPQHPAPHQQYQQYSQNQQYAQYAQYAQFAQYSQYPQYAQYPQYQLLRRDAIEAAAREFMQFLSQRQHQGPPSPQPQRVV
jgi:hypothetical protein